VSKTLTIDVPDDLHARLERQAEANQRSLNDEVVHLLDATVVKKEQDREALWERIDRLREEGPLTHLDPEDMKRVMRECLA
jgi:predicted transcriptional regulator